MCRIRRKVLALPDLHGNHLERDPDDVNESRLPDRYEAVCRRRAGKANISDMAALLDHANSDGLLRDSCAWDSQTMYSDGLLCAFR